MDYREIDARLAASAFRSRFRLTAREQTYLAQRGWPVIAVQAARIVSERLAPACPRNDGRQTPMRGHVVFVAQHATGCCCRGCLAKWHHIERGRELTAAEQTFVIELLLHWLRRQAADLEALPRTPDFWE